jgi:hypothetical protein
LLGPAVAATAKSTLDRALAVAESATDKTLRSELRAEVALALARRGDRAASLTMAPTLPPALHATVLLALAAHLPDPRGAEAAQLLLDAQTAKALTDDWRKARVARLLAVAYARHGKSEAAIALAHTVPDSEERAFALQDVIATLNRAGEVARARELAGTIEENRRYGTYRQKAAALADTARTLHRRGNADDAATLLAQAELLLPKKPGWADGVAYRDVADAAFACGERPKALDLLGRAEALARQIAGPWKVTELTRVAASWRAASDTPRATAILADAAAFLATLTPMDRADEALALAHAWHAAGESAKARALLDGILADADTAANAEAWHKPRVRSLLALDELFGAMVAAP